jgi:diaminopimelate epimerase
MKIEFTKMAGAGNDFIFLGPGYAGLRERAPRLAAVLCERRRSVGADGLIIVEEAGEDIVMRYFNRDGSRASFCGNGARCLVLYCTEKGLRRGEFDFWSESGVHRGGVTPEGVRVSMEAPRLIGDYMLDIDGDTRLVTLADAGVPHAVLLTEEVEGIDVEGLGRRVRMHPEFEPEGANADFVATSGRDGFPIRTYERGVEKETLACGSGCVAAALVLRSKNISGSTAAFRVASGDLITVELPRKGEEGAAYLTGPACFVFEGVAEFEE